jgi:hypothetical protein
MRIYITKQTDKTFVVYKEKTWQSILSDIVSALVVIIMIGMDILFSKYVCHSWVIDIFVVTCICLYFFGIKNSKQEIKDKQELINIINEL